MIFLLNPNKIILNFYENLLFNNKHIKNLTHTLSSLINIIIFFYHLLYYLTTQNVNLF